MTALTLNTVPPEALDAREIHRFNVAEDLLRAATWERPSHYGPPRLEESIRRLAEGLADNRRESFREVVDADLPVSWVQAEVELVRSPAEGHVEVLIAFTVRRPELAGCWVLGPGTGSVPTLALREPVSSEVALYGYAVEDGRPVYGPAG